MDPAHDEARTAMPAFRPSIAARPARAGARAACPRAPGTRAVAASVLAIALTLACGVHAQSPGSPQSEPGQLGAPEPLRPTVSTPYDGAIAAYRAGRADEALALAERALQSDPRNPQLRFLRGVILAERGRRDDAVEVFTALVQDYPELPEPYNNLAVIHAGRGDWDAARAALEQSIRAVPTYALAHENLGDVHLRLAARAYEQAGSLDPRSESSRAKLALARELIGRMQALPVDPGTPRLGAQPQVTPR